jgi:mono/diheme cytochrome c family protein
MPYRARILVLAVLLIAGTACRSGRYTNAGFRLPPDGNAERGQQAFLDLGCNSCHGVYDLKLPPPVQQRVPVVLGGTVNKRLSDAYLVTAMIHPQYASKGAPGMPDYEDRMTVRQMVDLVAFLQAQYTIRPSLPDYGYYR